MKDIIIFGSGGFAQEVIWTIEDINQDKKDWNILGLMVDYPNTAWGTQIHGYEVFNPEDIIKRSGKIYIANGFSDCYGKYCVAKRFDLPNFEYANLIHPTVVKARTARIDGVGVIIQAGSIIAPASVIKDHVTVNLAVTLGHDSVLHEYVTVAPGAHISGNVNIGYGTNFGTGAVVIEKINIGSECIIGANASVIRDVHNNLVVVGVPTKVVKATESRINI